MQDEMFLKLIEEFSKKTDSLLAGIKMEDVRKKNRIIRALDEILDTTVSDLVRTKANEQIIRIKAIPNIVNGMHARFA